MTSQESKENTYKNKGGSVQLNESFTVLQDGEPVGTFGTYEQSVEYLHEHVVKGRRYQVVKEFVTVAETRQTVADTGWMDEYRGMWAEEVDNESLCLVMARGGSSAVWVMGKNTNETGYVASSNLAIRPDLAPVNLTPHPVYLETLEDYQNAPAYTIVSKGDAENLPVYVKYSSLPGSGWHGIWTGGGANPEYLSNTRRKVLYWPEEEE